MGGKKKAAATADPKNQDDGEDNSTDQLWKLYRKNCQVLEIPVNKRLKEMYEVEYCEEQKHFTKIHLWDELGWQGVRTIMQACSDINYKHCMSIRLWKGRCQDEGARIICQYVIKQPNVTILELLDCRITPLGCEFLQKAFFPLQAQFGQKIGSNLTIIKLDHNPIGSKGMNLIAESLSRNSIVMQLSLTYCEITSEGGTGIFQILLYQQSKLIELALSGNPLCNDGAIMIFRGMAAAKTITTLYISDCQFDDSEPVMEALKLAMTRNKVCSNYDLRHNSLTDEGIDTLALILKDAPHVSKIGVSEWISAEALVVLNEALGKNKPGKKKKGKKGKKK